jgi:uncharacterized protein (DUF2132 family)
MTPAASRDPLHGVTLERMLTELVAHFGWPGLGERIAVRCFSSEPSIASSLKFLRKTPWARDKVESLYRFMLRERKRAAPATAPSPALPRPMAVPHAGAASTAPRLVDHEPNPARPHPTFP